MFVSGGSTRHFAMFLALGLLLLGTRSMAEDVVFDKEMSQEIMFDGAKLEFNVDQGTPDPKGTSWKLTVGGCALGLRSTFDQDNNEPETKINQVNGASNKMLVENSLVFEDGQVKGLNGAKACDAKFTPAQVDGKNGSQVLVSLNGTLPPGLKLTASGAKLYVAPFADKSASALRSVGITFGVLFGIGVLSAVGYLAYKYLFAKKPVKNNSRAGNSGASKKKDGATPKEGAKGANGAEMSKADKKGKPTGEKGPADPKASPNAAPNGAPGQPPRGPAAVLPAATPTLNPMFVPPIPGQQAQGAIGESAPV